MNNALIESEVLNHRESPDPVLLRLWNDVEQALATSPPVRPALVRLHPDTARTEEVAEMPVRVRYSLD